MIKNTRGKIGLSFTSYFKSIVVVVFALATALNKF